MNKKRILVLSTHDFPYEGHGYSVWKQFQEDGFDAYFVSYKSEFTDDSPYFFINTHKGKKLTRVWLSFISIIRYKLSNIRRRPGRDEYLYFNFTNYYSGNAKKILEKVGITPDIIIFTWCDFFISPKVIFELYLMTHAKIVISMVDAHLLGGGCHFPCDCKQYETGCSNCPALNRSDLAKKLYQEKEKYLGKIPLTVLGTKYDVERAKKTKFLKDATMISVCNPFKVPFILDKTEARQHLNLPENAFVLFWGAQNTQEKRKGFSYFIKALEIVSSQIKEKRICALILANDVVDSDNYELGDNITILQPGFLDKKGLFSAFYASDLFVSTSIDDSGPMMVNYSIACGTPVLSFPVGIALDLVKEGETGFIADFLNAESLAKGIMLFYEMDEAKKKLYSENCLNLMSEIRKDYKPWHLRIID